MENSELEKEEISSNDYYDSFIRDVLKDLKETKRSFVFTQKQLDTVKKYYDVIETSRDSVCIYIKVKSVLDKNRK